MGRCMCLRNHGGKKVIEKKRKLRILSGSFGHFKSEFRKKKYVVIFPITKSGRMQKTKKKKKKKKIFMGHFPFWISYFR